MRSKIKKGEMESSTHRRCQQVQCGYFINGGCKSCSSCKATSFQINKSCKVCYACENIPNELRFTDDKDNRDKLSQKVPEQDITIHDDIEVVLLPVKEEEMLCPR